MTALALVVPDPRFQPIPLGWWEEVAAPAVLALDSWDELDDAEARILAMASLIESMDGDTVELEKALRVVEMRRGELADPEVAKGRPEKSNTRVSFPDDVSAMTVSRWRAICRGWDRIEAHLRTARERREVSQAACLRLVMNPERQEEDATASTDSGPWAALGGVFDAVKALSEAYDATRIAAAVPARRRAVTARRLRSIGTDLGRVALAIERLERTN